VKGVAEMPEYTYDPTKLDFESVDAKEAFTIAPGPNNPVGAVWIDLDEPTYGIHGTPEPETIRRESSHGCVRLTNWDALQLADAVKPGVTVEFTQGD
jgi:lipoprotein-anchoring transpeptidase ErfK/SrfK